MCMCLLEINVKVTSQCNLNLTLSYCTITALNVESPSREPLELCDSSVNQGLNFVSMRQSRLSIQYNFLILLYLADVTRARCIQVED